MPWIKSITVKILIDLGSIEILVLIKLISKDSEAINVLKSKNNALKRTAAINYIVNGFAHVLELHGFSKIKNKLHIVPTTTIKLF